MHVRSLIKKLNLCIITPSVMVVPHVHWHVIPRYRDDRHFPGPVWSAPKRDAEVPAGRTERAEQLALALPARLEALRP